MVGSFLRAGCVFLLMILPVSAADSDPYAAARERLVAEVIEPRGVTDRGVLDAIRETPRHEFVPRAVRDRAYFDMALPIGESQTISSPFIVALMTETLEPRPDDRVLEIGTGSGYQAAVLSPLVEHVYTIEIVESLGRRAEQTLRRLNYDNVSVRVGDGFQGWNEAAPFDKIIVTCSPERVPQPLVDQLREGGRMIIPVGERYQQTLYLMEKRDGELHRRALQPTLFVPMTGAAEAARRLRPDPSRPELVNGGFDEEPTTAVDFVPGWYYGSQVELIAAEESEASANRFVRFENTTPGRGAQLLQGVPIDGRQVPRIRLAARVRPDGVVAGGRPDALPAVAISFYDDQRRELATFWIGPFRGTSGWRAESRRLRVPPATREAIVRIGLFGATGRIDYDDLVVEAIR